MEATTMNDVETHQKFISLRARGISFQRIAEELKVSKPTLIGWSRKFQYDQRGVRPSPGAALLRPGTDALRWSTHQLMRLVERLKREIQREIGPMKFTTPVPLIPKDEYQDEVQDWMP